VSTYWTAADAAELDVLIFEFVRVRELHVPACAVCREHGPWCARLLASLEAVLEWREGRLLRSKAAWLRLREIERERMPGRVHVVFDERGEVVEYELAPGRTVASRDTSTTAGRVAA